MHILSEFTPHMAPLIDKVGMSLNVGGRAGMFLISGLVSTCMLHGLSLSRICCDKESAYSYMYKCTASILIRIHVAEPTVGVDNRYSFFAR
jgi:hypothetical protein